MTTGPAEQQPLGTGSEDSTTALFCGGRYFQHLCCGCGGYNPWTVVEGPWKQFPPIPEAAASISQDEFTNHPSPAIPIISLAPNYFMSSKPSQILLEKIPCMCADLPARNCFLLPDVWERSIPGPVAKPGKIPVPAWSRACARRDFQPSSSSSSTSSSTLPQPRRERESSKGSSTYSVPQPETQQSA